MRLVKKGSKKGFTLVELMLSIAIICLISGLFVALIFAVKDSWYRVYNDNDATDYAALYAQALENQIMRDAQINHSKVIVYRIDYPDSVFKRGEYGGTLSPMFDLSQMHNKDGDCKWVVYLDKCNWDADNYILDYEIVVVDNYKDPGKEQVRYKGSLWVPIHSNGEAAEKKAQVDMFIDTIHYDVDTNSNIGTRRVCALALYTGEMGSSSINLLKETHTYDHFTGSSDDEE